VEIGSSVKALLNINFLVPSIVPPLPKNSSDVFCKNSSILKLKDVHCLLLADTRRRRKKKIKKRKKQVGCVSL
jgi:hypothetical protein